MNTTSLAREQTVTRTNSNRALDRLFAAYLALSGVALLFPHRPDGWLLLGAVHIVAAMFLLRTPPFGALRARLHSMAPRLTSLLHDWYVLLLIPALYTELAVLNRSVWNGRYFDELIIRLETLFFGGQPSQSLAAAVPELWLSEPLHFAYLSYYLIIFGPPLLLYLRSRTAEFRATTFTLMLTFFAHYLFFVYFPVQGPRYLFPAPLGGIEDGFFYQVAHRVLEAGSAQGSAFPSSHVGVSVAQTLCVARFMPRLTLPVALLTVGLAAGAVYGGFHYAIDAIVGAALGALMVLIAPRLQRALEGEPA
ncbi:MAG TPA: phosphatase PAP2 family protein [Longimicrobiales bacterium]|nr:phosphatase PAP2 family protein [Longimicrobiales bacterium]